MAKVLHAADFHLDSAFRALPEEQAVCGGRRAGSCPAAWWTGPTTTGPG